MSEDNKRVDITASFLAPKTALNEQEKTPDPLQQRREVLYTYSDTVNNFKLFFQLMLASGFCRDRLLTHDNNDLSTVAGLNNFQTESLVFNTRFQAQPFAIVMCQSSDEVVMTYQLATRYNLPIRVRAGGHDHEGESSGNNVILIDVSGIKDIAYCEKTNIVTLGTGYRFYELTPILAQKDRMIAHGTCATVGLAGFIQGGGWGPWTRKHGMCCEDLVGATVVLGNGDLVEVSETENSELLWALRGGGGMSWGIVTQLRLKTFKLPAEIHRFELEWNQPQPQETDSEYNIPLPEQQYPTIELLKAWEAVIKSTQSRDLVGTNLKINALARKPVADEVLRLHHHSVMFGYWQGSEKALREFIDLWFSKVMPSKDNIRITAAGGRNSDDKYDHNLMGQWARNAIAQVSRYAGAGRGNTSLLEGTAFKPDYDAPAPHKITSKLVKKDGLSDAGYRQLLISLTSNLLKPENEHLGLFSYVTLGAITGQYYQKHPQGMSAIGVAFPYQQCLYTIQYQTWWNESIKNKIEFQDSDVFVDSNRAMDWISEARNIEIAGAGGAFISFKDASIATHVYFGDNYERLVGIKSKFSKDRFNHLRTRKTII
ncbi:MAG: FAD-binding protein [Gammaproteobacteria bacterium]|nr:FAD-binding protein [Gammaproteobacteria bacterium]